MCSTLAKTLKGVDPTRLNFTLMPRPWQNLGHPGRDLHEDTEDMVAKEVKGETSRVYQPFTPFNWQLLDTDREVKQHIMAFRECNDTDFSLR